MRHIVILAVLAPLFLFGCSGDLSRGDAEDLLNNKSDWKAMSFRFFAVTSPDAAIKNPEAKQALLDELAAEGYLTPKPGNFNSGQVSGWGSHGCGPIHARPPGLLTCAPHPYVIWEPTEKLKHGNDGAKIDRDGRIETDLAKAGLGTVTGVAKIGENTFKVDYTEIWHYTAPGEMAIKHGVAQKNEDQNEQKSATVRKYDDGWRIEDDRY
jgi:hypothetical protein